MIAKTIFNNIEEIIDKIHELSEKEYDEEYFLSLVVNNNTITYQIEDGWTSPYNYQILKFQTEKIRGLTRKELSEKLATDIVTGSNKLFRSLNVLINQVPKIIEEEMSDITSEFLEVKEFPGTHYLSFYAYDNIIEYGFNTSIETSFGYDIFDNDLKLIKEQFEIEIPKKLENIIKDWKFLLEHEFNWKANKM
jgi:hypothetical protein